MRAFWIKFENHTSGCVEAEDETEARKIAEEIKGVEVVSCDILPYPAQPRLNKWIHPKFGHATPSFCYRPQQCKGHGSCPTNPYCTS